MKFATSADIAAAFVEKSKPYPKRMICSHLRTWQSVLQAGKNLTTKHLIKKYNGTNESAVGPVQLKADTYIGSTRTIEVRRSRFE